ncbi:MAG: glutamate-1-semialdehyde-2,1-aminomutase [SAR86 cluster bacterium]|uniref:Glutamate-1-semialdehyde 2,1-aminomutase n=1 Tax=SAR86 cluster bacterium TaxID=2030880 RepID=A0A520MT95_9GAMM|nr:MAG: glutamate-1-semialdehyde-2,1-aminomutase [SAR86 cluster bacterium]
MNKIKKSIELYKEAKLHMPGGVNSPVRAFKNINGNPIFFKKAKGAYLFDADNNKYIDYIGSWGPMIMGHSHPEILKAISKQLQLGTSYGAPTSIESDTAKLIKKCVPSIQKIRMVNSGTEATMSAIRLARGFTNRDKIIKFDGCYHGHVDSLLIKAGSGVSTFGLPDSPGIPNELAKKTLSCEFNNEDEFIKIFDKVKDDLAAVIVEPIAGNMGFIPGNLSFLKLLRKKTSENKSLLIFDEVMTGFRVSLGGAQEIYKIKPDLTTLGKVIGGGLPVGAFGGKKKIMDYLAPNGPVYQAGTLSGNPLAMAAGSALIKLLIKTNPYSKLENNATNLLMGMKELFRKKDIPFSTNQIGGMFGFFFSEDLPKNLQDVTNTNNEQFKNFLNSCINQGIYFAPSKFEAGFISSMHTSTEINNTISKVKQILNKGI